MADPAGDPAEFVQRLQATVFALAICPVKAWAVARTECSIIQGRDPGDGATQALEGPDGNLYIATFRRGIYRSAL